MLAAQLLDLPGETLQGDDLPVVLLSDGAGQYGLIVEAFQGEQDLVVRPLDSRLGKVPNVSAAVNLPARSATASRSGKQFPLKALNRPLRHSNRSPA